MIPTLTASRPDPSIPAVPPEVPIMSELKRASLDPWQARATEPERDRPPPYADPWREERWNDQADRDRFNKIFDLFAYPRTKRG